MRRYTISPDGQRVVFTAVHEKGRTPVWLASLNGQTTPRRLTTMDCWDAYFGAPGEVVFEGEEKGTPFIYRVKEDGSELQKMLPPPFLVAQGVSPDGRWVPAQDSSAWGAWCCMRLEVAPGRGLPRLFDAPRHRSGPSEYEMDTGRQIPLSEVCNLYLCDSPAARPDVAAHTSLRICLKGSRGRPARSATGLGNRRLSRSGSIQSTHM